MKSSLLISIMVIAEYIYILYIMYIPFNFRVLEMLYPSITNIVRIYIHG